MPKVTISQRFEPITMIHKKSKKSLLHKSRCQYSLYLFSKENKFRIFAIQLVTSTYFQIGFIALLSASTLILAVDTFYLIDPSNIETIVFQYASVIFALCYFIEAFLQIVAYGLILHSDSYLRDIWNVINIIILGFTIFDIWATSQNIRMLRVIRLFRVIRPLAIVSNSKDIKAILKALLKSLGALCNAFFLVLIIFLMFSIVGVSFFSGKFQYCTIDKYDNQYKDQCLSNDGQWKTYYENFDNVINGLIYLFSIATQVNWAASLYQAVDCTKVDKGPKMNNSWYFSFYYVVFIFIGCMFLMNIFLGIMFYNFKRAYKNELETLKGIHLIQEQVDWIEIQKLIVRAQPDYKTRTAPRRARWRTIIHSIVTSIYFEWFIVVILLLKAVELLLLSVSVFKEHKTSIIIVDSIFVFILTLEAGLKLIAFGRNYWYESWNVFELIVVLVSIASLIIILIEDNPTSTLTQIAQILRIIRLLRVTRILTLLKSFQSLQTIIQIIQLTLPSVVKIFGFMLFIIFIYALLGCYLFYDVPYGIGINRVYNFKNFLRALILCLKISTGEDWNLIMYDCTQYDPGCSPGFLCGKWYAFAYFLSFRIVVGFVIANLYSLIVLHFFEKYFVPESNTIKQFKEDCDIFQKKWFDAKPGYWGHFIHVYKLPMFFKTLPESFGYSSNDLNLLCKEITSLRIKW